MFLIELFKRPLAEKAPKLQFGEMHYGTWTIKYREQPKENGDYEAIGMHVRNPSTPKAVAKTKEEAINKVKTEIDRHMANDKAALKASKATIDYNVEFTKDILPETGITGVRLVRSGGEVLLIIAGVDYLEAFGPEIFGGGPESFTKLHPRNPEPNEDGKGTRVYGSSLTTNQLSNLGLRPNARYALEYVKKDMDYGHHVYKLVFDSDVNSKEDKRRLNKPGLTIAVF